ncbi:GspH/FimT family protein [Variovorax sp. J22P168]|uniref:GspH/FimT family pseudopilin n=1 Tax=Variovorax jilinensis TaxID=3053513 RepID=UPI002577FCCB|nr:GspH/FimT family protein [Variovorax sp. J22P168]MDM0012063.1 GspH/FimT family protein [Variovorax sp. J22P168]
MTSRAAAPLAHGLVLVELLVVAAIVAILAGLASPHFSSAIVRQRVRNAGDDLAAALHLARAEALRRGSQVVLRKTEVPGCPAPSARDWSCGWAVFADFDEDGRFGPGDELIQAWPPLRSVLATTNAPAPSDALAVNRWGRFPGLGAFRFTLTPSNQSRVDATEVLCMSAGGRVHRTRGTGEC